MKNLIFFLLFSLLALYGYGQESNIHIIPEPVQIQKMSGEFSLTPTSVIGYNNADARHVAEMLAEKLNTPTGFQLKTEQETNGTIQLNLNDKTDDVLGAEGYTLESSPQGVMITANQPAGLFYAMQTLLQLLPKEIVSPVKVQASWTVPAVKITDYPRFAWRGLMLDVSRHFFTKEEVEKYIDEMTAFKYNVFHWHLTDDNGWRIEIKSLPELTKIGACRVPRTGEYGEMPAPKPGEKATDCGYYTQEDIKEVVQYAKDRFVTIVPEIDIPGHSMAAIASYPELCCTKDSSVRVNPGSDFAKWYDDGTFRMFVDNTLNPSDEKVYQFLDKVFTEVAQLFPGDYIHIGGDECYKGYWKNDPGCQKLMKKLNITDVEKLQGYFVNRVEKILNSKGKKLIGWDEILDGGVSPGATVMSWRGIEGGIKAAGMGHYVVMTPTTYAYLDYTQGDPTVDHPIYSNLRMEKCYSYNPVPEGVNAKYILGGQGNLWTEHLPTMRSIEYMTYPRAWALAEDFWTPNNEKNWNDFILRAEDEFKRFDIAGINYSKAIYDPIVKSTEENGKLMLLMSSEAPDLDLYYSVDGTMPDDHSTKYAGPVTMPDEPFTIRVIAYKNGQPIGHLITLDKEDLKKRDKSWDE